MDKHDGACICADCHRQRIEATCATLRAENERLREALWPYANLSAFAFRIWNADLAEMQRRARAALEGK